MRGRNKEFLINGIKMIFHINWGITIDSAEVDSTLTYQENFNHLYNKYLPMIPKQKHLYICLGIIIL